MKLFTLLVMGALLMAVNAPDGRADDTPPNTESSPPPGVFSPLDNAASETLVQFQKRQKTLSDAGQWQQLAEAGRARRFALPDEADGWLAEATGAYMQGDVASAFSALQSVIYNFGIRNDQIEQRHNIIQLVRKNFPDLQLKPLQFVTSEADTEAGDWTLQSAKLLYRKQYDEIERVAAALQKSNAANILGYPHLEAFFGGLNLSDAKGLISVQSQLAAWQKARPQSNLARLAAIQFWGQPGARSARRGLCLDYHSGHARKDGGGARTGRAAHRQTAAVRFQFASGL